jgi:chromosome segregation ATPase
MSELVEIVDSLENKISKLLHKMDLLQQSKLNMEREMESLRSDYEAAQRSVEEWEEKYKSLKLANTMLGSETNKSEAKLKINQLIRELDHCIVQLAE